MNKIFSPLVLVAAFCARRIASALSIAGIRSAVASVLRRAERPTKERCGYQMSNVVTVGQLNALCRAIHQRNVEAGWWDAPISGLIPPEYVSMMQVTAKLALVHGEISEAVEGYRKGLMDDHLPKRRMVEVELADAVVRIADLAGYLKLDLGGAIKEKLAYNLHRADHKPENRAKDGGKKF